jgi:hypothetical protein
MLLFLEEHLHPSLVNPNSRVVLVVIFRLQNQQSKPCGCEFAANYSAFFLSSALVALKFSPILKHERI